MLIRKAIVANIALLGYAGIASAQLAPVSEMDSLKYEFGGKAREEGKEIYKWEKLGEAVMNVRNGANGRQFFKMRTGLVVFDPFTFTYTALPPGANPDDIKLQTSRKQSNHAAGDTWSVSFTRPYTIDYCPAAKEILLESQVISEGESTVQLLIDGKNTDVRVVTVADRGTYKYACNEGSTYRRNVYALDLKVPVLIEAVAYSRGAIASNIRMALKEIRRATKAGEASKDGQK